MSEKLSFPLTSSENATRVILYYWPTHNLGWSLTKDKFLPMTMMY